MNIKEILASVARVKGRRQNERELTTHIHKRSRRRFISSLSGKFICEMCGKEFGRDKAAYAEHVKADNCNPLWR